MNQLRQAFHMRLGWVSLHGEHTYRSVDRRRDQQLPHKVKLLDSRIVLLHNSDKPERFKVQQLDRSQRRTDRHQRQLIRVSHACRFLFDHVGCPGHFHIDKRFRIYDPYCVGCCH